MFYAVGSLMYEGEFQQGQFHGQGKLFYINGNLAFEGIFENG